MSSIFNICGGENNSFTPAPRKIVPQGTLEITENGEYDVSEFADALVAVAGGGGLGTLLATESLGHINYSSTSAGTLDKSIVVNDANDYDALLILVSADNDLSGQRLIASVTMAFMHTNGTYYEEFDGLKKTITVQTNILNYLKSSLGVASHANAYGIYASAITITDGTVTIPLFARYNSTFTGVIDNDYTAYVYGIRIYDML